MGGRKQPTTTPGEATQEYLRSQRIEHGEKIGGDAADWLDRRGTARNFSLRSDADTRHLRHRG